MKYLFVIIFTTISLVSSSLSFAGAGDLDPTFGNNGVLSMDVGTDSRDYLASKCSSVTRSDGAVYATASTSGYSYYSPGINTVVRIGPDGTLDTSFGNEGNVYSTFVDGTWEPPIALLNDSRVIVGAITLNPKGNRDLSLFSLTETGELDPDFGIGGRTALKVDSNSYDYLICIHALKSGDFIAVTRSENLDNNYQFQFTEATLTKIKSNGQIDYGFGIAGRVHIYFYNRGSRLYDIVEQADGKLVLAGGVVPDGSNTYITNATLIRLLPNGDMDASFGVDGWVTESDIYAFNAVASQPDGKVIAIGPMYYYGFKNYIYRYNQDGTLDTAFGNPDHTIFTSTDIQLYAGTPDISDVVVQQNGRILLGGSLSRYSTSPYYRWTEFLIVALNNGGVLDSTYDQGGVVITTFEIDPMRGNPVSSEGKNLDLLDNGKALLSGNISSLLQNSKITNKNLALARYTSTGLVDTSYANAGTTIVNLGSGLSDNWIEGMTVLQADGKILTATTTEGPLGYDFVLTRHNTNGSLDKSFNGSGIVTTDIQSVREVGEYGNIITDISDDYPAAIAVQEDGKIVLAGSSEIKKTYNRWESSFTLVRYNPDGTLDTSFGNNGIVISTIGDDIAFNSVADFMGDMLIQADGKIVVTGRAWFDQSPPAPGYEFVTIRYNTDGTMDPNFGNGGIVVTNGYSTKKNDYPTSIALQKDGKIVVGGSYTGLRGDPDENPAIIRYNPDGSLDTTFGGNGKITPLFSYIGEFYYWRHFPLHDLAITPEGKILMLGGNCTSSALNGWCHTLLAQFNDDGSLDSSFGDQGVVRDSIENWYSAEYAEQLAMQKDGRFVVTGQSIYLDRTVGADEALARGLGTQRVHFTQYDIWLTRFLANGSRDYAFGNGGSVNVDINNSSDGSYAVLIQPDAKIVTGGYTWVAVDNVHGHWNIAMTRHEGLTTNIDEIEGLISNIQDLVNKGYLTDGQGQELTGYLQATLQQADLENYSAAIIQLNNFIRSVNKYVKNGILTTDIASPIISTAESVISALQTA